jgi:hypothetical protein
MDRISILIVLASLFAGITFFRMYRRTTLKGHLLISLGALLTFFSEIVLLTGSYIGNERTTDAVADVILTCGIIVGVIGMILIFTFESGAAREAYSGHSILDIITGNVTSLEKKKYLPTLKRGGGLLAGAVLITYGIVKYLSGPPSEYYTGLFIIVSGLTICIISILVLRNNK